MPKKIDHERETLKKKCGFDLYQGKVFKILHVHLTQFFTVNFVTKEPFSLSSSWLAARSFGPFRASLASFKKEFHKNCDKKYPNRKSAFAFINFLMRDSLDKTAFKIIRPECKLIVTNDLKVSLSSLYGGKKLLILIAQSGLSIQIVAVKR